MVEIKYTEMSTYEKRRRRVCPDCFWFGLKTPDIVSKKPPGCRYVEKGRLSCYMPVIEFKLEEDE